MSVRSLGLLALVFVLFFALQLGELLFPIRPLDPAWQWRLATTLIHGAFLPLLALALLQIAVSMSPADALLRRRQRLFCQLAVAAAFGFLLLLPLQLSAGLRQNNAMGSTQQQRLNGAERRLIQLRQATASASSTTELNTRLQRLNGPVLGPADLVHLLPLLKAQVFAVFDQAHAQINRDRAALRPVSTAAVLPQLLRNSAACLLFAFAFAGFARRSGSKSTLLEDACAACVASARGKFELDDPAGSALSVTNPWPGTEMPVKPWPEARFSSRKTPFLSEFQWLHGMEEQCEAASEHAHWPDGLRTPRRAGPSAWPGPWPPAQALSGPFLQPPASLHSS